MEEVKANQLWMISDYDGTQDRFFYIVSVTKLDLDTPHWNDKFEYLELGVDSTQIKTGHLTIRRTDRHVKILWSRIV